MKKEEHIKRTLARFGGDINDHEKIHAYLDQYFAQFGPWHRHLLHHRKGINLIRKKFLGVPMVREICEQHIIDDIYQIPDTWAVIDGMELDFADFWVSKKTKLARGAVIEAIRDLYPNDAHLIADPKNISKLQY